MDDKSEQVIPGLYSDPPERLTRLAAAGMDAIMEHPEWGEDVQGAFLMHDQGKGQGTGLFGYPEGEELSAESLFDMVRHLSSLFAQAGIKLDIETVSQPFQDPAVPASEAGDGMLHEARLTLTGDQPDPRLARLARTVKEAAGDLAGTRTILIMELGDGEGTLLYHGYEDSHDMAHSLFSTFRRIIAIEGGHVAVIPVADLGTLN